MVLPYAPSTYIQNVRGIVIALRQTPRNFFYTHIFWACMNHPIHIWTYPYSHDGKTVWLWLIHFYYVHSLSVYVPFCLFAHRHTIKIPHSLKRFCLTIYTSHAFVGLLVHLSCACIFSFFYYWNKVLVPFFAVHLL